MKQVLDLPEIDHLFADGANRILQRLRATALGAEGRHGRAGSVARAQDTLGRGVVVLPPPGEGVGRLRLETTAQIAPVPLDPLMGAETVHTLLGRAPDAITATDRARIVAV